MAWEVIKKGKAGRPRKKKKEEEALPKFNFETYVPRKGRPKKKNKS